ncbi:hypothetical protein [Mycobacterium avium]|uniref:hypothetical protein n=1 Tax=Mycobacterium avium TaxID=1764 RepID=UPI001CC65282|nr:hypothetical protein [Mycobacterium avium]
MDPVDDLLHAVPANSAGWSETMYFHAWSPEEGVGVFVHTGRWPTDLDLWWAQTIALLPDGRLLVDRSWGRAADNRGPATGNLRITCQEPLRSWRLTFDGAGAVTDRASMACGPVGAGRAQPFSFDIELRAAAPVWDMAGALGAPRPRVDGLSWASFHHTQGFYATGELCSGQQRWSMDGVAHRDHSSGVRDVTGLGGLHFFVVVFPKSGRVANGLVNWRTNGAIDHRVFTVQEKGVCEVGFNVRVTGLQSYRTHEPHDLTITMHREAGVYPLRASWLHGYSLTVLSPNENINGVDLETQPDPMVITQSTVRVVAPDGEIGYGVIERDYRPSMLPSPRER